MTVPMSVRAAAALELRARQASGMNAIGVLIRSHDGVGWRWRGDTISDDEAALIRRAFRGQMIVVNRSPAPLPASA